MKFVDGKSRQVSLKAFSWDDSDLSRTFQGCGEAAGFLRVWENQVKPHLHPESGTYYPPIARSSKNDSLPDTRKRPNMSSPPSLVPATKTARLHQEKPSVVSDTTDVSMDTAIAKHFLGMCIII